jgi:glycosyltransferase involved in cell wall biosynthesis
MSIPLALAELDYHVVIFAPGNIPNILEGINNIQFKELKIKSDNKYKTGKIFNWLSYRIAFLKSRNFFSDSDIFWISSADSAIPIFGLMNNYKYILQINELYDQNSFYKFFLKKLSSKAIKIVVPELNRANIFRVWFGLKTIPEVLPNKSILPDTELIIPEDMKNTADQISKLKQDGYIIIIYQGHIGKDRDFSNLVEVLKKMNTHVHLILMGTDHGMVSHYKKIFSGITWLPHIKAPNHLFFTKLADIGIIYYNPESLNNIYCAPNKTWEYSKFGLPIISNDIPGMLEVTKLYNAGISCDFNNKKSITKGLEKLIYNYKKYSENSYKLYNEMDYQSKVKEILQFD